MSIRLMSMMWEIQFPTQSQLLIALKLADFANDEGGSVFPSKNRLARNAQCSESTVKNTLRAFRSIGLLHVVEEGGRGPKDTTHYAWNLRLVHALLNETCAITGGSEELEIKWSEKGAEFDPLDDVRGQSDGLRGQPTGAKGSAGYPQSFTNHHIETSSRLGVPATQGAARPALQDSPPRLVLSEDRDWQLWLNWMRQLGHDKAADMFANEGSMVVFSAKPMTGIPLPKLAPTDTVKLEQLHAARPQIRNPAGRDA